MPNPTATMLVIGDEILSGRTRDANMHYLAQRLTAHGVDLIEARCVADNKNAIIAALNTLRAQSDHVFTSGGIGPTHDDITADCVAAAFGVAIDVRDDAYKLLARYYEERGLDFNAARMRMARIPQGAQLIDNPVSVAPGFTLENVHVCAGVPKVFNAMIDSVLAQLDGGAPLLSETLKIMRGEGEIAAPLGQIAERWPDLSIGCYPFQRDGVYGANVVVRGTDADMNIRAVKELRDIFGEDVV